MRFEYETRRLFIGQERLVKQLSIIAEEIKLGENLNMLFEAPAGHGKNLLAYLLMEYVDPEYENSIQYFIPESREIKFNPSKRFHYLDEVHMLSPQELLYPYLSSGRYTIILGTNRFDMLTEAIVTRCHRFQFAEYSDEQIGLMIQLELEKRGVELEYYLCKEIAQYCRGNPRIAVKNYSHRLGMIFKYSGIPSTREQIHEIMFEYLGTNNGGFTEFDYQYLEALELNGGKAGLETLKSLTGLPQKTIVEDIEPFLIRRGKIRKTARGRILNNED
jgi:Holliday junction DNA helicase RuvB